MLPLGSALQPAQLSRGDVTTEFAKSVALHLFPQSCGIVFLCPYLNGKVFQARHYAVLCGYRAPNTTELWPFLDTIVSVIKSPVTQRLKEWWSITLKQSPAWWEVWTWWCLWAAQKRQISRKSSVPGCFFQSTDETSALFEVEFFPLWLCFLFRRISMPRRVWEPALTFAFPGHPVCFADPTGAGEHPLCDGKKTKAAADKSPARCWFLLTQLPSASPGSSICRGRAAGRLTSPPRPTQPQRTRAESRSTLKPKKPQTCR